MASAPEYPPQVTLLLASPYHLALDPMEVEAGKPYPPLGPLVSAAELLALGHDVRLYDATFARDMEPFQLALAGHRPTRVALVADPHAVAVKMCTTAQREATCAMVAAAKAAGAAVLVAGPDPTDHPEPYEAAGADVVVAGEHDGALRDFAAGTLPSGRAPRRPNRHDLAQLPDPAWDLVDLPAYANRWRSKHNRWELNLSTARGCPYRCNWCAKPTWGRAYATTTPERAAELVRGAQARGADAAWFTDDIFAVKPAWLRAFRQALAGAPLPFRCNTRADLVRDGAYVHDLAAAGCHEVWMGAESGSDRVLAAMDKDQTRADLDAAVARLRDAGIRVGFFLQLGYPGETRADVLATVAMIRRLRPDEIGVSVSYPLPGTAFHDRVAADLRRANWTSSMDNEVLFAGTYPQAFYDAVRELLRAEHAWLSFRPSLSRGGIRRAAALPYHAARWPVHRAKVAVLGR